MRWVGSMVLAGLTVASAGCASHELVRADEMSAAQHRSEAAREQGAQAPEHARQHAAAAKFLEEFEDEQCMGVDRASRAACPLLGPLVSLDDLPDGVRVTFADRSRVPGAIAGMRCHQAYARTRHFEENADCPLYVSGIEIRRGLDPRSIEIVARDAKTISMIRARSREQATFLHR